MPAIHDFESSKCGRVVMDVYFAHGEGVPSKVNCPCGKTDCDLELIWTNTGHGRVARGNAGEQSVGMTVFRNVKTGEISIAPDNSFVAPIGCKVERVTNYHEVQKLERQIQQYEYTKSSAAREKLHEIDSTVDALHLSHYRDAERNITGEVKAERANREAMELKINGEVGGYKPLIQDDAARARLAKDVAKHIIEQTAQKASRYLGIDTGAHIPALHNDQTTVKLPHATPDNADDNTVNAAKAAKLRELQLAADVKFRKKAIRRLQQAHDLAVDKFAVSIGGVEYKPDRAIPSGIMIIMK